MRKYEGIVEYSVNYRPYEASKKTYTRIFKNIEDARNFKNEVIKRGFYLGGCYSYIGKKIEL